MLVTSVSFFSHKFFLPVPQQISILKSHLSSANEFNFDQTKFLSFWKEFSQTDCFTLQLRQYNCKFMATFCLKYRYFKIPDIVDQRSGCMFCAAQSSSVLAIKATILVQGTLKNNVAQNLKFLITNVEKIVGKEENP